uniref:Uncharacterized protein n=1 Tax=Physcomitrium patens TaxID=3218 RepID=A0A2K1IBX9_PHYPA|nr:hypothetical protein PHYPA_030245 [Physcomitrium patens]
MGGEGGQRISWETGGANRGARENHNSIA